MPSAEKLTELAADLRASGKLGRSYLFIRLFDFLLKQGLAGRLPKEFEIAQEVFGKDADFDVFQDSSVRVHIHRLRRKLEEIYAGKDERLTIPRGEYRIVFETRQVEPDATLPKVPLKDVFTTTLKAVGEKLQQIRWPVVGATALIFAAGLGIGGFVGSSQPAPADPRAKTAFWEPIATNRRLTFIATGDYISSARPPIRSRSRGWSGSFRSIRERISTNM